METFILYSERGSEISKAKQGDMRRSCNLWATGDRLLWLSARAIKRGALGTTLQARLTAAKDWQAAEQKA